jgi:peptide/nickel transport system substrate-binding protein
MKINTKKLGFVVTVSLLVLSSLAAGQTSAATAPEQFTGERVITYAFPYDFAEFTVWTADSYATAQWTGAIYNGLLTRESQTRNWVPDLADSMPTISSNLLTFTFTLQEGLKFENGDPLTADDVIFSYKVGLAPAINTNSYAFLSQYLTNSSMVKIDDLTVEFTLTRSYAFALSVFSSPITSEEEWGADYDACVGGDAAACDWNDPTGGDIRGTSGPFMFDSLDTTNQIFTVVRNPNYYNYDEVQADKIVYVYIADKAAAISELAAGNIDILDSQYVAGLTELIGIDGVVDKFVGSPSHQEISPNHQNDYFGTGVGVPDDGPNIVSTDDDDQARYVRNAMSHIVNRAFFVNEVLEGLGQPAATAMPSASQGWDPSIAADPYNITIARELMEKAGFDFSDLTYDSVNDEYTTSFFSVTVLAPDSNPARNQWSLAFKNELSKIGIYVDDYVNTQWSNIIPRTFGWDGNTLVPDYANGGFDIMFVGYSWSLDWDPSGLYDDNGLCDTGSCDNFINYQNTTVADKIVEYTGELDFDARNALVSELQEMLAYDKPVIPILYPQEHWGWVDNMVGIDALLLSSSSQNWDEVRKAEWDIRVDTVSVTNTESVTNTATETQVDTATETSTLANGPFSTVGIIIGFTAVIAVMSFKRRYSKLVIR